MTQREKALKKNKTAIIVLILIAAISFAGGGILISFTDFGGFVIVFAAIIFIAAIATIADRVRIKRSYCPYCGKKYDYEEDIAWETDNVSIENDSKQVATLDFECTCSACGKTTTFSKKFTIGQFDNQGNYKEYNVKSLARKYFK